MGGDGIVRGMLKDPVVLHVEILPAQVPKSCIVWLHNYKKLAPRYRVRFDADRRQVSVYLCSQSIVVFTLPSLFFCSVIYNGSS